VSLNQLAGLIIAAWSSITLGLVMWTGEPAIVPLSVGIALAAIAYVYGRAYYVAEVNKPPEAKP
jgi:hypothetical protein